MPSDVAPARWSEVAGDFFDGVPPADLYVLSCVLHDWNDDECVCILTNCRKAMRPGGRIAVFNAVVRPGDEPDDAKLV
ncbi:methyltransferase [Lentzea sp. NPDC058450]|uniref:methyltransferase n=1 Tax=Lentzea sp. NPDC058450 TaxID=3346505 RepID=UPI0036627425